MGSELPAENAADSCSQVTGQKSTASDCQGVQEATKGASAARGARLQEGDPQPEASVETATAKVKTEIEAEWKPNQSQNLAASDSAASAQPASQLPASKSAKHVPRVTEAASGASTGASASVAADSAKAASSQTTNASAASSLSGNTYVIESTIDRSKVLDITWASRNNGVSAQLWSANGTYAQAFRFEATGDGYYVIRPHHSAATLDADEGGRWRGARVQQWERGEGNQNQHWKVQFNEDGTVTFLSRRGKLALDVPGARAYSGSTLQTWTPNGTRAQRWRLVKVGGIEGDDKTLPIAEGTVHLESATRSAANGTQLVLDVSGDSTANYANIQAWNDNSTRAQRFVVTRNPDSTITFISVYTGKAIDVSGASRWAGTNVQMYSRNGTPAQKWKAYALKDGTYVFRSMVNGLALTLGSSQSGANAYVDLVTNSALQRFRIVAVANPHDYAKALATRNATVRVIGDSVTEGWRTSTWTQPAGKVVLQTKNGTYRESTGGSGYARHLKDYVRAHGGKFTNAGVGRRTMQDLNDYATSWIGEGANVAIVMLGQNDYNYSSIRAYKANAKAALAKVADKADKVIVMSAPAAVIPAKQGKYLTEVDVVLRGICESRGWMHVSLTNTLTHSYYADAGHPNDAGHVILWNEMRKQLLL